MFLTRLLLLPTLLISLISCQSCPVLRTLLDDSSLLPVGPNNDICIIDRPNCCTKSTEERLLTKTKEIFKNRIFLVLNELLGKIDKDNKAKLPMMTKFLSSLDLDLNTKKQLNERFYSFLEGTDTLTDLDLDKIHTAAAIGALKAGVGNDVTDKCADMLFFELQPLKDTQEKYIYSVLLMLRGYTLMKDLINTIQLPDLTEQCYIAAVRGGMKFGGCNLCLKETESSQPCKMLCRNILSGCLKGHIQSREYLQRIAQDLVDLNSDMQSYYTEVTNEVKKLADEIDNKISTDQTFFNSCSKLKSSGTIVSEDYTFELDFTRRDALQSLDSSWLCTYVFSGVSEVNCWNRTAVDEYRVNVYEFTKEGQGQNPEVPGDGPTVDLEDFISQYDTYSYAKGQLSRGNTFTGSSAHSSRDTNIILITLTLTIMEHFVRFY